MAGKRGVVGEVGKGRSSEGWRGCGAEEGNLGVVMGMENKAGGGGSYDIG